MPIDLSRVKAIFLAAAEKTNSSEQEAFLHDACGADEELRRQVEALLRQHEQASDFLESPPPGLGQTADSDECDAAVAGSQPTAPTEEVGTRIGPYKLLQNLGEGGMGAVWVAEQQEPVKRRVAIKVIKPGMDSRQVIRRFEAERQALALMDHTNIAKVLDAGTTPEGRPYFVMELIKGVPITKYCDELHLPLGERLELFMAACHAIQHAHQKGIIHRDIKPSNVLVAVQDGKPVPKVIDFGVAKALHQPLTDQSVYTEIGQVVGTLEYMSPEQAELSALDIDTRADIYALGVLLYELLTGTTPLDRKRLKTAAYAEMLRIIKEEEPPRPSTRLSQSQATLSSVAAQRRSEPAKLTKEVRGDLDWIVMKCLEKDRTRRYETASSLARDIERHLHDEPVEASPPAAGYRLRKLLRRNKRPVLAAALVLLALVGGIIGTSWQAIRATLAEQQAKTNEQAARTQETLARNQEGLATENAARAELQRQQAVANLYGSLVGEARALRLARVNGYRAKAWQKLREAMKLETPSRDLEQVRQEAVACMGDFTGLEPTTFSGFKAQVSAIAPHPQGTASAIGLSDGTVLIKVLPAGADLARLGEHRAPVTALAFGRDGNKLVSADTGGTVKVWELDLAGGWVCARTIAAGSRVNSVALSHDGAQLVVCCPGTATIGLWSLVDGARIAGFDAGEGDLVGNMALSADGSFLAASYYKKNAPSELVGRGLLVWDVAARQLKVRREWGHRLARLGPVHCMAFSVDSKLLACGCAGIILLDTADYHDRMVVHLDSVWGISFGPDNRTLALASQSNVVRLWDVAVNREVAVLDHPAVGVALNANGHVLLTSSADLVKIWSPAATAEKRALLGHGGQVTGVAFSPNGKLLASSGGQDSTVVLWDTSTGRRIRSFPSAVYYTQSVAFSPDSRILATAERGVRSGELEFWDVASGEKLLALHHVLGGETVAFSPNGGYVAACGRRGVTLWRVKRNLAPAAGPKPPGRTDLNPSYQPLELTEVYQAGLAGGDGQAVYFSPDSKLLACALGDGTMHVCDVESRRPDLLPPARLQGGLLNGGFLPDGKHLIVAAATPEVWDVATGEKVASFGPGQFVPPQTALSRDGRRLAVRRRHWALDVWDVATRNLLVSLPEERIHIWSHALSPDGELLAVGLSDGGLAIWNLAQVRAQLDQIGLGWKEERGAGEAPVFPKVEADAASSAARRHQQGQNHLKHGQLLAGKNRLPEAALSYRRAAAVLEKLVADSPGVPEYDRSLDDARRNLAAALAQIMQLHEALAGSYHNQGNVLSAQRRFAEAEKAHRQACDRWDKLAADFPDVANYPFQLAYSHGNLALALEALGRADEALAAWRQKVAVAQKLVCRFPGVAKHHSVFAGAVTHLANELRQRGQPTEASQLLERTIAEYHKVVELDPKNSSAFGSLGNLLLSRKDYDGAGTAYKKAIEIKPDDGSVHNSLAWLLATCPDPKLCDPGRAVKHAQKAVELAPKDGNIWNTLGVAQYRAGDCKAAVTALEKSMALLGGRIEGFNTFFLAMAHWQLGNKEEARKWHDRAVEWMDKNQPNNEELRGFRAEAGVLLGDKDQPAAETKRGKAKTASPK
jgi:WD40 repeat protein/serine/threonine protein kinase/tetratricopeptide (TPR) repeat protein